MSVFYNQTFTDQVQNTAQKDSSGGTKFLWTTLTDAVTGDLQDANGQEITDFDRLNMQITHILFTDYAGFAKGHRVIENLTGKKFDVKHVLKGREFLTIQTFYVVYCEEMVKT